MNDREITHSRIIENSFDPLKVCEGMIRDAAYDVITATGYGRHLFENNFGGGVISEIKAFALGAREVFPSCRTVLDIGGQDIKVISLDERGRVRKFEMNDRCSAGTGRFLEIMAVALGCSLEDFGALAMKAGRAEKINSMCTVFAESEVISLLAKGAAREEISQGIHKTIVDRSKSMLGRINIDNDVVFVGGVALNPGVVDLLEKEINKTVHVPENPQIIGALGCALYGLQK